MIKFYFNFITQGEGKKEIQELTGFDASKFSLEQDNNRYGRDVVFAGGESNFSIYQRPEHHFDLMQVYLMRYGFESEVELIIDYNGNNLTYDVDFASMITDQLTKITFKAVQKSKQILLKRRRDVNVDLLSNKDLDGNPIIPCAVENVLIKAKPIVGISEFESTSTASQGFARINYRGTSFMDPYLKTRAGTNNAQVVVKEGLKDTLSFISPTYNLINSLGGIPDNGDNFTFLEAQDDILNAEISIKDIVGFSRQDVINFNSPTAPTIITRGSGTVFLQVRVGFDIESSQTTVYNLYSKSYNYVRTPFNSGIGTANPFPSEMQKLSIPLIKRGQRVWIYFNPNASAEMDGPVGGSPAYYAIIVSLTKLKISITGTSVAYNTVNPAIRLYDAMRYICKSVSGMEIDAPNYMANAKFYDQFLFTGNFLRGITDKGFYMNFEEIQNLIKETDADFQIKTNDSVFFGNYPDFYTDIEAGVIEAIQFESYERNFNEKYKLISFKYKYPYQSQKEKEIENTIDVVHGEIETLFANKKVENKREIEIKTARDPFLIEENRVKAYDISDTTATQDDDKKFVLDCRFLTAGERNFITTSFLQHSILDSFLTLKNTSNFSFKLLGIALGDVFTILSGSQNAGRYNVLEVTGNLIKLSPLTGTNPTFNGESDTQFQYYVSNETVKYTNWTDQGFTEISNIASGNNFSNLRFTVKRNIINYFSQFLATANLWRKTQPIKKTLYKNNPEAKTTYEGVTVVEGSDFIPENPILSTYQDECEFSMTFEDYVALENKVRDLRGYVRYIDANGVVTRGYPSKMEFVNRMNDTGLLTCTMEVKYEPEVLKIFSDNETGIIRINDFISVDKLSWTIDEFGYLLIFDETGLLLFTKTLYDRVSVNGSLFENKFLLEQSLNNL